MSQKLFLITSESPLRYEGTREKTDTILFFRAPAFLVKSRAEYWLAQRKHESPRSFPKELEVTEIDFDASRVEAPPFKPQSPFIDPQLQDKA